MQYSTPFQTTLKTYQLVWSAALIAPLATDYDFIAKAHHYIESANWNDKSKRIWIFNESPQPCRMYHILHLN